MSDPKPEHFQTIVIHVQPWTVLMADPGPLVRGMLEAREACGRCRETGAFILPDDVANDVREWIRDTDKAAHDGKPKSFRPLDGMQTK